MMKLFDPTRALSRIPARYRLAWEQCFLENRTRKDIAQTFPRHFGGVGITTERLHWIIYSAGLRVQRQMREET